MIGPVPTLSAAPLKEHQTRCRPEASMLLEEIRIARVPMGHDTPHASHSVEIIDVEKLGALSTNERRVDTQRIIRDAPRPATSASGQNQIHRKAG